MTDFYRRNLPHWIPEGQIFFITIRLANSLPLPINQEIQEQREQERQTILAKLSGSEQRNELYRHNKRYFGQFDSWLDRCVEESPRWLADERVAQIVADEIRRLDGERYRLIAYCIMSNHVHLAVDTGEHIFKPTHEGLTAPFR